MSMILNGRPVSASFSSHPNQKPLPALKQTHSIHRQPVIQDSFQSERLGAAKPLKKPSLSHKLLSAKATPTRQRVEHAKLAPQASSAQYNRKEIRNPIPFNELDMLLKELENEVNPKVGSILKYGHADGLKRLLSVGNQLVTEVNALKDQGHQRVELVLFYEGSSHGQFRDPHTDQVYDYVANPEKQEICTIPTPLRQLGQFDGMDHWSNIAQDKQASPELQFLDFPKKQLSAMKKAATPHRFDLSQKDHLSDYTYQLFSLLKNIQLGREDMADEHYVWDDNPDHYKVGIRSVSPLGEREIKDLHRLFPGCDLKGYKSKPLAPRDYFENLFKQSPNQ